MRFKIIPVLIFLIFCLPLTAVADPVGKIEICHKGGTHAERVLNINPESGPNHFGHGDWLVSEEMCDAIADNNCDGAPDPIADDADCAATHGWGAICTDGICETLPGDTPVGTITQDINRGGIPPGVDRGVESAAVNLAADAQLWATLFNGAEVAFMNPGGVRSDLTYLQSATEGDGVVTFGEASTFQPFGNTLLTFPMTGAQILSVLQEQCQPSGASRPFLHLGVSDGFTYDLSTTIVAGECTSVAVANVQMNGINLDPAGTYIVTANSFIADGGDNFATFATIDPSQRLDGGSDLEALVNFLSTFSPVPPPSTDRVNEN